MANPQKEHGYTGIANEILDHLVEPGINGSEYRVLLFVIRKTYGFHKKKDRISLSQFAKSTKMNRREAIRTIKRLVGKRIILKENGVYSFNKNWEEWVVGKRPHSGQLDTGGGGQLYPKSSGQLTTHKRKKEIETKETLAAKAASWVLEEKLQEMEEVQNSYKDIIATFIREKPVKVENAKQLSNIIGRYCRIAQKLSGAYTNKQIFEVAERIKKDNEKRQRQGDEIDWTLETIYKYLTK